MRIGSGSSENDGKTQTRYETHKEHFAVFLNNKGYPASLEIRKLYQAIPDSNSGESTSDPRV